MGKPLEVAQNATSNTNSQKCGNTSVNQKPNPVRVLKSQNGYAIL
jgi:hypothetical protein